MKRQCSAIARPWVSIVSLLAVLLAFVAFAAFDRARPAGTPGVVSLELAFSAGEFARVLREWGPQGVAAYERSTFLVDYWFPLAYALLLASLTAQVTGDPGRPAGRRQSALLALPILAAALDWLENTVHLLLLRAMASISTLAVMTASLAALVKWFLLAVSIVVVLLACAGRLRARWKEVTSHREWMVDAVRMGSSQFEMLSLLCRLGSSTNSGVPSRNTHALEA